MSSGRSEVVPESGRTADFFTWTCWRCTSPTRYELAIFVGIWAPTIPALVQTLIKYD